MFQSPVYPGKVRNAWIEHTDKRISYQVVNNLAKRSLDFTLALISLIFLAPGFLIIAILIRFDSPGPIFYWGPRVGKGGRLFKMLKFRTMFECPESYRGPRLTCKEDERITSLGRWLRDSKINELPQLWNVLIGDMSLVGPRPEDPELIPNWPEETRREILKIRPGITSPASILYHNEEELLSTGNLVEDYFKRILPDKMRLDRLYVRNHSFFTDLDIIFWTIVVLIPHLGKIENPDVSFFAGPIASLFHRYVSWFTIDLLVSLLATGCIGIIWRVQEPLNWGFPHLAIFAVLLALLFSGLNAKLGFNRILWSHALAEDALGLVFSSTLVTLFVLLCNYCNIHYHWLRYPPLPHFMIFTIGMTAGIGFIAIRYRLRLLTGLASRWLNLRKNSLAVGERVLIIGAGEASQIGSWLLRCSAFRNAFSIVGLVVENDPLKHGMRVDGCWVVGGIQDLPNLVMKYDVGIILIAIPEIPAETHQYINDLTRTTQVRAVFLYDLLNMIYQKLALPVSAD